MLPVYLRIHRVQSNILFTVEKFLQKIKFAAQARVPLFIADVLQNGLVM